MQGTRIDLGDIKVFPRGRDEHSNDIVAAYAEDWKADIVISLYDAWALRFSRLDGWANRWAAWLPVDHETAPPAVVDALRYADHVIAFSKHGQTALKNAGFENTHYIPHGVDTSVFSPGDKTEARKRVDWPQDKYIVGMVAANNFYPSRKCIPQAMQAFAAFHKRHPDTALYMHMVSDASRDGIDLRHMSEFLGLKYNEDVIVASQFDYIFGYAQNVMNEMYRGMDVLLNPSMGEGFGIPIVEALACDKQVIATRSTAMTELVEGCGVLVDGDPFWTRQGAMQTMPYVGSIIDALEQTYNTESHGECRERALLYDYEKVVAPAWDEWLRGLPV